MTIPSTIDSLPVTGVGEQAFYCGDSRTSAMLPDILTSIDYAFEARPGLASITLPKRVGSIGFGAFYDCGSPRDSLVKPEPIPVLNKLSGSKGTIWRVRVPGALGTSKLNSFAGRLNRLGKRRPLAVTLEGCSAPRKITRQVLTRLA